MIYNNLDGVSSLRTVALPCLRTRRKGSLESMGDRAHGHGEQAMYIHVYPSSSVSLENPNFYSPEK